MDPHSIKRPRILPPDAKSDHLSPNATTHSHHTSDSAHVYRRPGTNATAIGLNASNTMFASGGRFLLNGTPIRRDPKESSLFHKDTHHRNLPKHQQIQLEREKKLRQQQQLRQAHEEFHRQRTLHMMQQQQQQQQQQQHQHQEQLSTSSAQPSDRQYHHHHHHHHHYHVHPFLTNTTAQPRPLNTPASSTMVSPSVVNDTPSTAITTAPSTLSPTIPPLSPISTNQSGTSTSLQHHHYHHHQHHTSLHQQLPQRSSQFSEWTNVKERERARLLSNMARVRGALPPHPSTEAAKENLRQLSRRIHQRRTRARETILYDLHQGVKSVEAQVHKQVEMVLSKLKDTPGSKYAFALTHTFLTQLPNALSNTILPSAISAVADTVAGRTTNSLTTLRGRVALDEYDDDEEDEEEDEDEELDDLEDQEETIHQQHIAASRHHRRQDSRVSQQFVSEFGTIDLASPTTLPDFSAGSSTSSPSVLSSDSTNSPKTNGVTISSAGATEFLAASTQHNYSTAASQVLSAALPSFIPSIVCAFSYPSPPASKPNSPDQLIPPSPGALKGKGIASDSALGASAIDEQIYRYSPTIKLEDGELKTLQEAINYPAITAITSTSWTAAEREALYVAAARHGLRGQWSKIRQMMGLHRTDQEIEREYERLYGDNDDDDDDDNDSICDAEMRGVQDDDDLVPIKKESDVEDVDADDEAEASVSMRFGDSTRPLASQDSVLMDIQPFPTPSIGVANTSAATARNLHRYSHHHNHHRSERNHHHHLYRQDKYLLRTLNEKSLRVVKKEFTIDKRFTLEDIPMHL